MKVTKNCMVTVDYSVCDTDGNLVDGGAEPIVYLHGGYDDVFEKIEDALDGKGVGDSVEVLLLAVDSFGEYDEELVEIASIDDFDGDVVKGAMFEKHVDERDENLLYTVTEITDDKVVLDANHPLSGMDLIFSCTVMDIREASDEEISSRLSK